MAAAVFAVAAASFLLAGGQAGGSQSGWTRTLYSGLPETHERVGKTPAWIHRHFIPFGAKRKHQMARYSLRHYGVRAWRLKQPKQIVEHVAVAGESLWDVSQHYGVKLSKLAKYNALSEDARLSAGQRIALKKPRR